jgi:transcriptional regulator with XRE-family HTH domain
MQKCLKLRARIIEKFGVQADFAEALGVDESLVSRILHGRRTLSSEDSEKWAKLLKCKAEELFQ